MTEFKPDRVCQCGHRFDAHVVMLPTSVGCLGGKCRKFRPRVFATHRQLTGTPYIHHAYVYDGIRVVASCYHRHGERRSVQRGSISAMACAERMLRRYLRRISPESVEEHSTPCYGRTSAPSTATPSADDSAPSAVDVGATAASVVTDEKAV